jgi:hypothetical protein
MEGGKRHLYELRSYDLKPGTMVEWGNYWAKAVRLRDYKHTEAFLGTFSQVKMIEQHFFSSSLALRTDKLGRLSGGDFSA